MAGEARRAARRVWFQVHKWIGLILMVALIPLSLSGAVLVWHDALDEAINPQRYAVSGAATLPVSRYVAAAHAALSPGDRIAMLRLPDHGGPVVVSAAPQAAGKPRPGPPLRLNVYLDPPTARVLDVARSDAGAIRFLHVLHGSLQIPGIGRSIVGWLGVFMFVSCVSGLWIWWPAMGRFLRGLRWQRGDRRFDTNLHHQIGFWLVIPLGMLCFTGAWISFPAFFGSLSGAPAQPPRRPGPPAALVRMAPEAVLAAAGPGKVSALNWPSDDGLWHVTASGRDITVDDATGVPQAAARVPGNGGIARTMRRWHDGTGMGPVWQVLIVLAGIAPTALGITGITMWLRSRRWRRTPTARRTEAARDTIAA